MISFCMYTRLTSSEAAAGFGFVFFGLDDVLDQVAT